MFATASQPTHTLSDVSRIPSNYTPSHSLTSSSFLQAIIEGLIDGIIITTVEGDVVRLNDRARHICNRLIDDRSVNQSSNTHLSDAHSSDTYSSDPIKEVDQPLLPEPIWQVCKALIESGELFPNHRVIPEAEVLLDDSTRVRVRSQWFDMETHSTSTQHQHSHLLITLEDREQSLHHVAATDIIKYGLTPREGEVWQLRLLGNSYDEIADKLYISRNTVGKHIKNIFAKRRMVELDD